MKTIKNYGILYSDTDNNGNLKLTSLLKFLEDVAIFQSEERNVGIEYYKKNKKGWALYKYEINLSTLPKLNDEVIVETEAKAMKKFFAHRSFMLFDKNGNELVKADTQWIFIDTEKKRPIVVNDDMIDAYGARDKNHDMPKFNKIENPANISNIKSFEVRNSDIDTNNHVNHICYLDWAVDTIPNEILLNHEPKKVRIDYLKEVGSGEEISSEVEILENDENVLTKHQIICKDKISCVINIIWEPKIK